MVIGILSCLAEKLALISIYYKILVNIAFYSMLLITILIISGLKVDYKLSYLQYGIGCLVILCIGLIANLSIGYAL
jgi:hypothetical protein